MCVRIESNLLQCLFERNQQLSFINRWDNTVNCQGLDDSQAIGDRHWPFVTLFYLIICFIYVMQLNVYFFIRTTTWTGLTEFHKKQLCIALYVRTFAWDKGDGEFLVKIHRQ